MDEISLWLLNWFKDNKGIEYEENKEKILNNDFFQKKYIDSLDIMNLIADIEDHFQIEFSDDNFQDRRFSTIKGLSGIISEHKHA